MEIQSQNPLIDTEVRESTVCEGVNIITQVDVGRLAPRSFEISYLDALICLEVQVRLDALAHLKIGHSFRLA